MTQFGHRERCQSLFNLHVITLVAATLIIGWLMMYAGLQKNALEWKRRQRICPSCGRLIKARVCSTCT